MKIVVFEVEEWERQAFRELEDDHELVFHEEEPASGGSWLTPEPPDSREARMLSGTGQTLAGSSG
jgi:hypothetical protein